MNYCSASSHSDSPSAAVYADCLIPPTFVGGTRSFGPPSWEERNLGAARPSQCDRTPTVGPNATISHQPDRAYTRFLLGTATCGCKYWLPPKYDCNSNWRLLRKIDRSSSSTGSANALVVLRPTSSGSITRPSSFSAAAHSPIVARSAIFFDH